MKKDTHPKVHPVVFVDPSGAEFVTTSTLTSEKTKKIDGVDHYVVTIEISSASHPFYTGKKRLIDTAGRVDKFLERQKKSAELKASGVDKKKKRRKKSILEFDLSEEDIVEEKGSVKTNKKKTEKVEKKEEKVEAVETKEEEVKAEAPAEEKAEAPVEAAPEEVSPEADAKGEESNEETSAETPEAEEGSEEEKKD